MGFLRRVLSGGEPVPEWAPFFSGDEYRAFISAVEADLRRRGHQFRLRDGYVELEGDAGGQQLGLANLAQLCNTVDRDQWAVTIATHFSSLFASQGRDFDAIAADFDQARPILRVRLFPDQSMGGPDLGGTVSRPLVPGILEALVFDFPDSTAGVLRDHLGAWPLSEDAVMVVARTNTLAEPVTRGKVDLKEGLSVELCEGNFYAASHVFDMRVLLPPGNRHGAIVAIPNRHSLVWFPIEDAQVITALTGLGPIATHLFDTGPGSISNQLYWWRDGDLVHLPIAANRKGGFDFAPPEEFIQLLNSLVEPSTPA